MAGFADWLGRAVGGGIGRASNWLGGGAQAIMPFVPSVGRAMARATGQAVTAPTVAAAVPAPQQRRRQAGGFAFPQQWGTRQGQAPMIPPWLRGQAQSRQFALGQQGALGQMGALLQGNAQRVAANRALRMQYGLGREALGNQRAAVESRNRMAQSLMASLFGALRGEGAAEGPQRAVGGPGAAGGMFQGGPAGAVEGAAGRLYGASLGGSAPAAMWQSPLRGFRFAGPSGQFGGATTPSPPWAGNWAGNADVGIDTTPGRTWGPQHAAEARSRLGGVVDQTAPFLAAVPGRNRNAGLGGLFSDYLRGATARTYGQLERAGTKAEASGQLESQVAKSQLQNALWQLISKLYGGQMGSRGSDQLLNLRMLQALY